ncbi:MAG: GDP-L-fucose synthase [Rhodospirillaceae bacterium]|nr:GDP-L-fucose synthase [Rhodospirillaceae bacterium]
MSDIIYPLSGKRVWVAGHSGMVGAAVVHQLQEIDCEVVTSSHAELDLARQTDVEAWMADTKPNAIIMAAARVGGIHANNTLPVDFLIDNIQIETNVFTSAHAVGVERMLFLGSSCIYPRLTAQPMREESLLTGPLEPTNQWYALAKIAGVKMAQAYRRQYGRDYISCMPTNLYGPGDSFDLQLSHVLSALIVKAHQAKELGAGSFEIWGTGKSTREFLYVDDLAAACIFLMERYSSEDIVNVGYGREISITDLAAMVAKVIGFEGVITKDLGKPDGTPRKLMDSKRINEMGWQASTSLEDGIGKTYAWYLDNET